MKFSTSLFRGPCLSIALALLCFVITGCNGEQERISAELSRLGEQVSILVILMGACWVVMSILAMSLGISVRKLVTGQPSV